MASCEDVIKATITTINIFKSSNSSRSKSVAVLSPSTVDSGNSLCGETLETFSNESVDETSFSNSFPYAPGKNIIDLEFLKSVRNIQKMNEMYYSLEKLWHSKRKNDAEILIKDFSSDNIEASNINKTVERLKSVVCHLQNIIAERAKLKQVLRSNVLSDVWHINKEYHKSVVNFFTLGSELVKNIDSLIIALERRKEFNPDGVKILQKREMEFLQVLQDNKDSLQELRSFVKQHSIQ